MAARKCDIPLIAKIEKHEALDNIDEIIPLVEAVMVARGDLGVEIPLESVPRVQKWLIHKSNVSGKPLSEAVAFSACNLAEEIRAAAIISFTQSGLTARLVSKFRPAYPILALTPLPETYRRLSLVWGLTPVMATGLKTTDEMIDRAFQAARKSGLAKRGQKLVITAGVPLGVPGKTNLVKAEVLR
jgi:pyruvate kinase